MELLAGIKQIWLTSLYWWAGCCVVFLVLTRFSPCNPGRNWWHDPRGALTDFVYWLLMPLLGQFGRMALLVAGVMLLYGRDATTPDFTARGWPLWLQCVVILLAQDVMMYWLHRLFHSRAGWRFHAIHHSSETLDWTSASRFHPVNVIGEFAVVDAVVLLAGFSPLALAVLGPVNLIYSVMVHANLNWTFGPLRHVFASPVFHRWHHTSEEQGLDKNFAPTFPFLDWIWGTFHMPAGVLPEVYGVSDAVVPAGPLGQTLHPFRGLPAWPMRHPMIASALMLAVGGLSALGWQALNRAMPEPEPQVADARPAAREGIPPELLAIDLGRDPKATNAVAVNADGSLAIYGLRDGSIHIRDVAGNRESVFFHHRGRVNALAISPDGSLAVSGAADGNAVVFDARTGKALRTMPHPGINLMCVAVGDDGWVATGGVEGSLNVWNAQGELAGRRRLEPVAVNTIALSGAGRQIVAAQGSQVSSWNVIPDKLTRYAGTVNLAYCVQISRDGRRIAAGEYDGRLHLWELDREQSRLILTGHDGPIYSIAIGADGETLVTGGADQVARQWDSMTGKLLRKLEGHPGMIFSVSLDRTGKRILAAGKDNSLTHWNAGGGEIIPVSGVKP